jgi:hypothetical protein
VRDRSPTPTRPQGANTGKGTARTRTTEAPNRQPRAPECRLELSGVAARLVHLAGVVGLGEVLIDLAVGLVALDGLSAGCSRAR